MTVLMFVGERKSATAKRKGWTWQDGRLAAKQLFDALDALALDRQCIVFANAFERGQIAVIRAHVAAGGIVIAMGRKAQRRLDVAGVSYTPLVHPAARGAIRLKQRYAEHIRATLEAL